MNNDDDDDDIMNDVKHFISKEIYNWFLYLGWGIIGILGIGVFVNIYFISHKKCVSNTINIFGMILIGLYLIPTKIVLDKLEKKYKHDSNIINIIKATQKWWYVIMISIIIGSISFFVCNAFQVKN
tara:strand:+ start:168 stop:545 length:378 start_codon:yes stop_codon:yes gene_type:complete